MNTKLDKQTIAWTGGIIAATILFLSLVTWPQFDRIGQLTGEIESARAHQKQGSGNIDAIAKMENQLEKLSKRVAAFDLQIPDREQLGTFLKEVARCAQAHNLSPDDIKPGTPERSDTVVALPISFTVDGPFDAIHGLIRDIEGMPRLTRIDEFEITSADQADPGSVSAEVNLKIFFQAS